MTHYHLLGRLEGLYLPNMNKLYDSFNEAQEALKDIVEDEIDQMVMQGVPESEAENNVWWSRELDYVRVKHGSNECYEIVECNGNDCIG